MKSERSETPRRATTGPSSKTTRAKDEPGPGRSGEPGRKRDRPGRAGTAVGAVAALLFGLLRAVWSLLNRLSIALAGPARRISRPIGGAFRSASRALTPARGILIAALGCAVLLGLSQFADYRGVAIGVDDYAGVETVAPAPEVDRAELGSAHGYAMIPVALAVIALLVLAVRRNRWQLCRVTALVGLGVIAVSLLIDRPSGLDEGSLVNNFAGVEAQLLGGWWVQLFAGIGLTLTSMLLAREIRRAASATAGPASRQRRGGSRRTKRGTLGTRSRADAGARGAGA